MDNRYKDALNSDDMPDDVEMVAVIYRTLKTVRVDNRLLKKISDSGRKFSEVVNTALSKELGL